MRSQQPKLQIPLEQWPAPGTPTFALFFPDLDREVKAAKMSALKALLLASKKVQSILRSLLAQRDRHVGRDLENVAEDVLLRIAAMNAVARYDSTLGTPTTFLKAIARTVLWEQFCRAPKVPMSTSSLDIRFAHDGCQLLKHIDDEDRVVLSERLNQLSAKELRCIVAAFGPLFDHACPVGRTRRSKDGAKLRRAIASLRAKGSTRP